MTTKKAQKQAKILKVLVTSTSKPRVLRFVRERLRIFDPKRKFLIVTPNPEMVMRAEKDENFANILNSADLALPDGIGLSAANKFFSLPAPKNKILRLPVLLIQGFIVGLAVLFKEEWLREGLELMKGREMFLELMKLANKKGWRVFLLGGEDEAVKKAANNLRKSLKKVAIEFTDGPMIDIDGNPISQDEVLIERKTIKSINEFKPHLLFVAFGAPKQERWLNKWLGELNIGGAMVVGGTFDYMAQKRSLPPQWVEKLGLEWLWRLLLQPGRARRIMIAFPFFPLKVFWHKLSS
jgi:N-acetylglucosaminyldiphosphoundecaprenol N-acetyl-beta-D-mannosaminyltransferase